MAELQKAKLQEVKADENQTPLGDAIPVQFNPTSLKLKLTNQSSGGRSRGQQRRQNNAQSSTVLSMDLIFDSADEGSDSAPVTVREKTSLVEKFVLPKEGSSDPPPLLRFEWDKLIIVGVVEGLEINFDHFAANGAPLRAKMGLSIKEQEPKYAYLKAGPGKKKADSATNPGTAGDTAPGKGTNDAGAGGKNSDRSDTAMEGETAPEFLARQGLDPAAWRGLDVDLSAGLSLEAGIEVGFSAGLSASFGVGISAGVQADVGISLEASLGISASAVLPGGTGATAGVSASSGGTVSSSPSQSKKIDGNSAGLALSAAGGIQSAIETVKVNETNTVSSEAQSAFGIEAASNPGAASASAAANGRNASASSNGVSYMPLAASQQAGASRALATAGTDKPANNASTAPTADPRSTSYGYGVPLKALYAASLVQQQVGLCSRNKSSLRDDSGPAFRKQKTTSPWIALPQRDTARDAVDESEATRGQRPCACNN